MSDVATQLKGAKRGQLAIFGLQHRQHVGINVRGDGRVAIWRKAYVIWRAQLEAVPSAETNFRHQQAGAAALGAVGMGQSREAQHRHSEKVERGALIADPVPNRIVHDPDRVDLPGRILGTPFGRDDRARRVGRAVQYGEAVLAAGLNGREATTIFENEEEIFNDPVAQIILKDDAVAISHVPGRAHHSNVPDRPNFACGSGPDDAVGAEAISFPVHPHLAGGGNRIGILVIDQLIGAESDLSRLLDLRGRRILREGGTRSAKHERERGPADRSIRLHKSRCSRREDKRAYCT